MTLFASGAPARTTVFIVVLRIAVYIRIIRGVRYCTCLT